VRAQILRQLFFLASTTDGDSTESHVPRKLDTKIAKAANALHSHQVSTTQAGVAESVVGRDPSAEKGSGFRGCELIRNRSEGACFSDHQFRISSIRGYSRYHGVLTIHGVSPPARFAHSIFSGNEADTDALTDFPFGYSGSQRLNAANHFMSRNTRKSQTRVDAHDRGRIRVTDSACFHPNPNLTCSRFNDRPLLYSKHSWRGDFYCFVCVFHLFLSSGIKP